MRKTLTKEQKVINFFATGRNLSCGYASRNIGVGNLTKMISRLRTKTGLQFESYRNVHGDLAYRVVV